MKINPKCGIGLMLTVMLLVSMAFIPVVSADSDRSDTSQMPDELKQWIKETREDKETELWMKEQTEQWMQNHTLNVTSTKTYRYTNGQIEIREIYTGKELTDKLEIDMFKTVKQVNVPVHAEKSLSLKGEAFALTEGNERIVVTEKTVVMTTETDPFEWWNIGYEYPQYTWSEDSGVYTRDDPINLAWEKTYLSTVKTRILNQGWVNVAFPYEYDQYVSDPQYGWILDDGVADDKTGLWGRYHTRLWQMSNGDVVGGAHHDDDFPHEADQYEEAEDVVAGFFDNDLSNWWVLYDNEELDNEMGTPGVEPWNDGEATCIWRVGGQS